MTLEAYIETAITTDVEMLSFYKNDDNTQRPLDEWFYSSESLGLGPNKAVPRRPYIAWNELSDDVHREVEETSNARNRNFTFYVYDEMGDYTRIEAILNVLRRIVKGLGDFNTDDGVRCSASAWLGVSGRIPNDGYASSTKFASVSFTVSR